MQTPLKKIIFQPFINYLGKIKENHHFSKPPILIGGCGRSGTTLLLSIISAHPHIFAFSHEVDAFTDWKRKDNQIATPTRLDRFYRSLLVNKIPKTAQRWCEKRPYNVLYIKEILEYWPQAKFIHIVRDARDVLTSHHPQAPNRYWVKPERWIRDVSAGYAFRNHQQVYTLKFEDLVENPNDQIKSICKFIDEPYTDEMKNWYEYATVRSNRAWFSELQQIHKKSLKKWQRPEHKTRLSELEANPQIIQLQKLIGYY
mgnify:CR=1 FL=1